MTESKRRALGWVCLAGFLVTIPLANYAIRHWGTPSPFPGGPHTIDVLWWTVPSGTAFIGLSFVLRDVAQYLLGRKWAWIAIAVGALLSWWLADATIAIASAVAFFWSESTDALIFTPLANRGQFALGVWLSGVLASVVDSFLFLWIAFGWGAAVDGWFDLFAVKTLFVLVASPIAFLVRRAVPRYESV